MISRRQFCSAVLAAPVLACPTAALAAAVPGDVVLMHSELSRRPADPVPGLYLSVNWEFDLPATITESLHRGIAMYFMYEFRLERLRWYWLNQKIASVQLLQRVSYSPLSQQYRLSRGGLTQSFDSLDQVLALVKNVQDWRVGELNSIQNIEDYRFLTRMALDTSRLPKPLQVAVGGNSDWSLESSWEPVSASDDVAQP